MLFLVHCIDKPDGTGIRGANRNAHLEHLERHADRLFCAGPLLSDDGAAMVGSAIIIDFDDRAGAEQFAAEDPYAKAGLFQSVTIRPWRKVYPKA